MSEELLIATPSVFGDGDNFLLERELGRGGMGGVYMGRDKMLDRPVAVKVMLKEYGSDAGFVEKFKKEAQAAARLIHPNIAQIYSYNIFDGMPYIAMELVTGGSLYQIMQHTGANSDVPRVLKICEQVAQALRCASDQGLVHGDVKPENVLLDANGNAKLVDFGLAAMQKDTDEIWGTPYYIAPEKVKKEPIDYRADMYSLGGTIYHALCGVAPFEGDDANAVVRKRFEGPARKPSEVRPGLSPQIDYLVMKMLQLDPKDRYPTFEALLVDFKKVLATGLNTVHAIPAQSPQGARTATGTGTKKLRLSTRRKTSLNASAEAAEAPAVTELADAEDEARSSASGGKRLKIKGGKKRLSTVSAGGESNPPPSDEGNVGGKVAMFIGIIIAVVIAVAGLLFYVIHARKVADREKYESMIGKNVNAARTSFQSTREKALNFADEMNNMATAIEQECVGPTESLSKLLSEKYSQSVIDMLKPPPPETLLKAIASTNIQEEAQSVAAETNAVPAAAETNAPPVAAEGVAPIPARAPAKAIAKFRAPVDDEADPNSPEGQKYLEEKAKWEAEQKAKAEAAAAAKAENGEAGAASSAAPEAAAAAVDADGKSTEVPPVVKDVNGIWERAYNCRIAEITIRGKINLLVKNIDNTIEATKNEGELSEEFMKQLVALADKFKGDYDAIHGSEEVSTIAKGRSYVQSKGKKSIEQTERRLREEKLRREREEAKRHAEEEEKRRKAEAAAAKAKKIAEETELAKKAFQDLVDSGKIRQLDWKISRSMLDGVERDISTAEGSVQLGKERKKIDCMELMQNTLIRNMKGYTFTRAAPKDKKSLRGATVVKIDNNIIRYAKKGSKKETDLPWQTFLKSYHSNLDEVISKFIVRNEAVGGTTKDKLSAKDRFDAIMGVAFILRIVCADNPSSTVYAEKLLKESVKKFPARVKLAKDFFPDIDFSEAEAAAEAENL